MAHYNKQRLKTTYIYYLVAFAAQSYLGLGVSSHGCRPMRGSLRGDPLYIFILRPQWKTHMELTSAHSEVGGQVQ